MHIQVALHTDPRNHELFPKWVNSLDYGSRPFCREWRVYDVAIQPVHKDLFLADLKYYYKDAQIGLGKKKTRFKIKIMKWVFKLIGLGTIDMDKIELTPKEWHKPMTWAHGCTNTMYALPLFTVPDAKDPKNKFMNDMI